MDYLGKLPETLPPLEKHALIHIKGNGLPNEWQKCCRVGGARARQNASGWSARTPAMTSPVSRRFRSVSERALPDLNSGGPLAQPAGRLALFTSRQ